MAKNTVKYWMWGDQTHFRWSAEYEAERLLSRLDPRFKEQKPQVYLVGILTQNKPRSYPVCVVPDDCPYQPEAFDGFAELAEQFEAADPEKQVFRSLPEHQQIEERKMRLRALRGAILQKINKATDTDKTATFVSWPTMHDGYLVMLVLQLPRRIHDSHHCLTRDHVQEGTTVAYYRAPSLLQATINEFLDACANHLHRPNPGTDMSIIEEDEELLRAAAKQVMYGPAWAGGNIHGLHGLFEACNAISTLKYEGKEGVGRLVFAHPEHSGLRTDLTLLSPVPLRDYGAVRKLLQLATGDLCLFCDSSAVYGIGAVEDYDPDLENLFVVRFTKNFMWDLSHAGNPMMYMRFGAPHARLAGFPEGRFLRDLPRVFPEITRQQTYTLRDLAQSVASQKHGAMLVISASAPDEAARLANQATCVQPFKLTDAMIRRATSIDGAVLVDRDGTCHAIGIILDGLAHPRCTPSRGARYNSAVRYAYGHSDCMVVVKSEDGMVDLFPELMPQIRRTDLGDALGRLGALGWAKVADGAEYNTVMHWLSDHRFYLSAAECEEVNRLSEEAGKKVPSDEWRFGFPDFAPDPEMNDSYFLAE